MCLLARSDGHETRGLRSGRMGLHDRWVVVLSARCCVDKTAVVVCFEVAPRYLRWRLYVNPQRGMLSGFMSDRVLYVSQLTYYPATYGTKAWRQIDLQRAAAGFRLSKLGLARGFEMSEFVVDDYFPIYFGAQTTRSTQPVRPTTYRTAGKRNAHVRKSSFYNPLSHHRNFLLQTEPRRTPPRKSSSPSLGSRCGKRKINMYSVVVHTYPSRAMLSALRPCRPYDTPSTSALKMFHVLGASQGCIDLKKACLIPLRSIS